MPLSTAGEWRRRSPKADRRQSWKQMSRWQCLVVSISWALFVTLPGCVHPQIMTKVDYDYYNRMSINYDHRTYHDVQDLVPNAIPRTVTDPNSKKRWEMSLEDAKQIAIQNNKQILALAQQPGQQGATIALQLSVFDAFFSAGGGWGFENQPLVSTVATTGQANSLTVKQFGRSTSQFLTTDIGGFGTNSTTGAATQDGNQSIPGSNVFELFKRNATGGTTRVSYTLDYRNQDQTGAFVIVNPAWTNRVNAEIQQPFLQGAGVEFNRAPILIARTNYEQSIRAFETAVQTILREVETAYWQLGFSYYDLYSREIGMEQALSLWQRVSKELEFGTVAKAELAQARQQYEAFRADRIRALNSVFQAERTLRLVLGLQPDDNRQIIPSDDPIQAEYQPDWDTAVAEALSMRPDIVQQTLAVRAAELSLFRQQNGLLPSLTGNASWGLSGLDNQFDQSIDRLTDNDFESWELGLRYTRQIGERAAHAAVRNAQLTLDRERNRLKNTQHTAMHELAEAYRNIATNYALIEANRENRRAAAEQLDAGVKVFLAGRTTVDDVLQFQVQFANAIREEGRSIAQYNQSLAQWEFAKGTILVNDNVMIAESSTVQVDQKLLRDRQQWWANSLPLPIWGGSEVHADNLPCPPSDKPFYPDVYPIDAPNDPDYGIQEQMQSKTPPPDEGAPAADSGNE